MTPAPATAADGAFAGDLTGAGSVAAVVTLTPADLAEVGAELAADHAHFAPFFARREQRAWATVDLRGRLTAAVPRKNVEAMALRLVGVGPQAARQVRALQPFIGEGAWEDTALRVEHQRLVAASLGAEDGVLILDGSGALGKIAICQAGVFLGSASRTGHTLRRSPTVRA
jgi:hypothetical protein